MNLRNYIGKSDFTSFDDDIKQVLHKFMLYNNEQFADLQQAVDDMERIAAEPIDVPKYRSLRDLLGIANEFVFDFFFAPLRSSTKNAPHFLRSMEYLSHVRIDPGIIEPLMRSVLNKMKFFRMLSFAVRPKEQRRWTNSIWTSDKMNCMAWIRCLSMHSSVIWPHEKLCLLVCRPIFFG